MDNKTEKPKKIQPLDYRSFPEVKDEIETNENWRNDVFPDHFNREVRDKLQYAAKMFHFPEGRKLELSITITDPELAQIALTSMYAKNNRFLVMPGFEVDSVYFGESGDRTVDTLANIKKQFDDIFHMNGVSDGQEEPPQGG